MALSNISNKAALAPRSANVVANDFEKRVQDQLRLFEEEIQAFEASQFAGFQQLESRLGALETFYREEVPSKYPSGRQPSKGRPAPKRVGLGAKKPPESRRRRSRSADSAVEKKKSSRDGPKREPEECSICTEPLVYQRTSRQQCGHRFHTLCFQKWVNSQDESNPVFSSCPRCNKFDGKRIGSGTAGLRI